MHSRSFAPIAHPDARVLILGSLPGRMSLEMGEYYAQPRNAFWRIMQEIFGIPREAPYNVRCQQLTTHGIALWDVCAEATRQGSLDTAIALATVKPHDFARFFQAHRRIGMICFNGTKAGAIFERMVVPRLSPTWQAVPRVVLPSTSPAHAGMGVERKSEVWKEVLRRGLGKF